jgi:hypothetical protein
MQTDPDYLIKGLLPQIGLAVTYGPPGCGKSFWAADAALHVASGREYQGRRVRGGPVVYIAGEGQTGFVKRLEAFRREKMEPGETPPFYLLPEPLDLIGEHQTLIADIERQLGAPALVVLDTLNRTLRGSENDPEDMGNYIAASDKIRDAFGCCVHVIHHCGVEGSRPRGHTALTGAADAQFAVSTAGSVRTVQAEKVKDGPADLSLSFELRSVDLGTDSDGDPVTSCVVEPTDSEPDVTGVTASVTGNARTMLTVLQEAGWQGLTTAEWAEQAREAGIKAPRQRLYEYRVQLKNKRLVHQDQQGRWHITNQ